MLQRKKESCEYNGKGTEWMKVEVKGEK